MFQETFCRFHAKFFRTNLETPINIGRAGRMLILTRKTGESILIGDDIEVIVTSIDQNKVRVGIKSPAHIPIYREELYRKIQQENRDAASIGKEDIDSMLELFSGVPEGDTPENRDDS